MVEIRVEMGEKLLDCMEAFEAELACHNLTLQINDKHSAYGFITLRVNAQTDAEHSLVREMAALCFGDAPAV